MRLLLYYDKALLNASTIPQHEVHELETLSPEELVPVGGEHQSGAERVEQILHVLHLILAARVMTLVCLQNETTN